VKVAWVQDISRPHGGAENSNRTVVAEGFKRGHDIVGVTPLNFFEGVLQQAELFIINNFFEFPKYMVDKILARIWDGGVPYVVYSHDHRDVERRAGFARKLFRESRLNVFISPRHLRNYRRGLGCEGKAYPLAIDTSLFSAVPGVPRSDTEALIVGGWMGGGKLSRSLKNFVSRNPQYQYVSVGHSVDGARVIPKRPLELMPVVYSSAHTLVHMPDIECAGERVVFEAALCGVKEFHLGEKVGHASWGYDLTDRDALVKILRDAVTSFWQEVEHAAVT
jgi:hypothetical protein